MRKLTQKFKRLIVMLLVCGLVAGNAPVNAYATEAYNQENVVEEATLNKLLEDYTMESVSQNVEFNEVVGEEILVSENDIQASGTVFESAASEEKELVTGESDVLYSTESDNIAGGTIVTTITTTTPTTEDEVEWKISAEGKLTVTGKGSFTNRPWSEHKDQILSAEIVLSEVESLDNFFNECINLGSVDLKGLDASAVVSVNNMFYGCSSLEEVDLSSLDLAKVSEAWNVFDGCDNLTRVETPKNLPDNINISLPLPMNNWPTRSWYEFKTDTIHTAFPTGKEESITLLKREKGFGKTVSLTLDSSRYGSELDLTFFGEKENNEQYTYDFIYYYNDTELNPNSLVSFTDPEYTTTLPINVSDVFGGKVSGETTIYVKALIDGYEMAKSNSVTISIAEEKLETVKNIKVNGQVVTWDPVDGAAKYNVQLSKKNGNNYTNVANFNDVTGTSLDFSEYSDVAQISIRALTGDCASKLNSDFARYTVGSSTPTPSPVEKNYVLTGNEGSFKEKDGTYTIIADGCYTANVYKSGQKLTPVKAAVYNGNNVLNWRSTYIDGEDVELSINSVSFNHLSKSSTKKLNLKVTTAGVEETTIPLFVYPGIEKVTVSGVKKGKATQAYNTEKEYALTTKPMNMTGILDVVGAEVIDEFGLVDSYRVENGKLIIKTAERNGKVEVRLYNIAASDLEEGDYEYFWDDRFTLEITGPEFTDVKPTVALQNSTNTELELKLGATGVEIPEKGKLWYEVTTELVNPSDEKYGVGDTINYYPYEEGDTVVNVAIADVKDDGTFPAVKNNVTVSVVQTTDDLSPSEGGTIQFRTNTGKVATLKKVSTKAPIYETNLKLKKGTTKIFTGQEKVVVATPQFSKNTYFKFKKLNLVVLDSDGRELTQENSGIAAVYEDGKIYITVEDKAIAGKYQLVATTVTPDDVKSVTAAITFEVVYGINTIWFRNIPGCVYKQAGKVANLVIECDAYHFVPVYENVFGESQGNYYAAPYKNSVKFSVVGPDGNELDENLKNAITIKNNKITIAKDFEEYGSTFRIKAEATDYAGNTKTEILQWNITICEKNDNLEKFDKIVIGEWIDVNGNEETDGFRVVDDFTEDYSVSINDVKYYTFAVLRDGAESTTENGVEYYPFGQVIGSGIKFTSSNKNVMLDGGGYIQGLSKAGKTNITATATDGSGRKLTLKGVNFQGTKSYIDVQVGVGELTDGYTPLTLTKSTEDGCDYVGEYKGVLNNTVLEIVVGNDNLYDVGANYTVKISGAKTLQKYTSSPKQWYYLQPNKQECVITVDNKNTGEKYTYTLKNVSETEEIGTVNVEGKFTQYSRNPEKVTLKLPVQYAEKYVKLYVDNAKFIKDSKYSSVVCSLNRNPILIDENGNAELALAKENFPHYSGTFKLSVCVGDYDEFNGSFVPSTKSKEVKVSVAAMKLAKVNTSYTLNLKDTDRVELTTNNKDASVVAITSIQKMNSKTGLNNFTNYFEINGNSLKLKDTIDLDLLEKLYAGKAKDDFKGWITCQVKTGDYIESQSFQITINAKNASAAKFTASDITVVEDDYWAFTTVNKIINKVSSKVNAIHITADDYVSVNLWESDIEIYTGSEWKFKPGKTTKVTIYVLDDNTPVSVKKVLQECKDKIDWELYPDNYWEYEEMYNNLIKKFGNKVTFKVTVLKKDKVDDADKVKLAANSVTLTDKNLGGELEYLSELEYTEVIDDININDTKTSVTIKADNKDVTEASATVMAGGEEVVKKLGECITVDSVNKKIKIAIPQPLINKLVAEGVLKWGGTLTVSLNVELHYGFYDYESQEYVEIDYNEKENFTIKLPEQPKALG